MYINNYEIKIHFMSQYADQTKLKRELVNQKIELKIPKRELIENIMRTNILLIKVQEKAKIENKNEEIAKEKNNG